MPNHPGITLAVKRVSSLPNADIVDWVLVEIRQADYAQHAVVSTAVSEQAAFLLKNGSIVGMDGLSNLQFNLYRIILFML